MDFPKSIFKVIFIDKKLDKMLKPINIQLHLNLHMSWNKMVRLIV